MQDLICQAIRGKRLIEVTCKGRVRQVEPYLVFESKNGSAVLHSWQVSGEWDKSPPPDWCNLRIEDIDDVKILDRSYHRPHQGYNPDGPQFHTILCQV
jgi:hypothetical protein